MCLNAQKRGWHICLSKSVPAQEIERVVVEQIKAIGRDPSLIAATIREARKQTKEQIAQLGRLEREFKRSHAEVRELVTEATAGNGATAARLSDLTNASGSQSSG